MPQQRRQHKSAPEQLSECSCQSELPHLIGMTRMRRIGEQSTSWLRYSFIAPHIEHMRLGSDHIATRYLLSCTYNTQGGRSTRIRYFLQTTRTEHSRRTAACVRDVAVVSATSGERAHVCVLPEDRTALQPSCALRKGVCSIRRGQLCNSCRWRVLTFGFHTAVQLEPLHFLEKIGKKTTGDATAGNEGKTPSQRVEAELGDFLSFSEAPIIQPLPPLPTLPL